jgi:hypothetical protein
MESIQIQSSTRSKLENTNNANKDKFKDLITKSTPKQQES